MERASAAAVRFLMSVEPGQFIPDEGIPSFGPVPRFRKTCRRWNAEGHAHALTFSCFRQQPFLSRDRTRTWFLEALQEAGKKHSFDVWAYVVMPEHVHLLIRPREANYSISAILADLKQPVTRRALEFLQASAREFFSHMRDEQPKGKIVHRFWQRGGGYDRNLFNAEEVCEKINYIHDNPVRRGLAKDPAKWLWSSARYYFERTDGLLAPDLESLKEFRLRDGKLYPR